MNFLESTFGYSASFLYPSDTTWLCDYMNDFNIIFILLFRNNVSSNVELQKPRFKTRKHNVKIDRL